MLPAGLTLQARDKTFEEFRNRGAIMLCSYKDHPSDEPALTTLALAPPYHGLNDCTHYTTECLIAGGFQLRMNTPVAGRPTYTRIWQTAGT
jgi:hypothetical protein